jgi:AraC-like DNA-binding protein
MERMLKKLGLSRRWLEYRFSLRYGCTPVAFIEQARLVIAKQMLVDVDEHPLTEVAKACGLAGTRPLCSLFQRSLGMTPTEYRKRHRPGTKDEG